MAGQHVKKVDQARQFGPLATRSPRLTSNCPRMDPSGAERTRVRSPAIICPKQDIFGFCSARTGKTNTVSARIIKKGIGISSNPFDFIGSGGRI